MTIEEFLKREGYYIDGVWYPRVTAICQIKSKPALYYFYAKAPNYQEANRLKQQAASEGTLVHSILENMITGKEFVVPPEYIGIKQAFDQFLQDHSFHSKREWLERRIKHPNHRYSGTFDILAEVDGELSIVDIKTAAAIYDDYRLQTAAYLYAVNEEPWLLDEYGNKFLLPRDVTKRYILRLGQKKICEKCGAVMKVRSMGNKIEGGEEFCDHRWGEIIGEQEFKDFDEDSNYADIDFKAFLHCKGLWEWENREYLNQIGYL